MNAIAIAPLTLPQPFDRALAARAFERLAEAGYVPDSEAQLLLASAFGNSAYLSRLAAREGAT